ncbi:unnamed protein product [Cylicocyclus nassatus]|uniref:Uncharacterized protein n=1 Tax=Cylicocyclus nassatus TaxID=53992 RepID=A0AA36GRT1_CYLNA|nr:unnamed protein product [Cylicocyclus nassatus]
MMNSAKLVNGGAKYLDSDKRREDPANSQRLLKFRRTLLTIEEEARGNFGKGSKVPVNYTKWKVPANIVVLASQSVRDHVSRARA